MIISNNLVGKLPLPEETIIRINLAWIDSYETAQALISSSEHEIYLDYPDGRKKPPRGILSLTEAIQLSKLPKVKYFAVSNCEDVNKIDEIRSQIDVEFVPKIETLNGVKNMMAMVGSGIKTFMLDKEDLYTDVKCDSATFTALVEEARKTPAKVLELKGVIFD